MRRPAQAASSSGAGSGYRASGRALPGTPNRRPDMTTAPDVSGAVSSHVTAR
ncbi:MAG TPA: hypothetical protein VLJ59_09975 [Mycobacteriales bacterium]|nr:hypothetical protein [Mycobacteriales bacterium]